MSSIGGARLEALPAATRRVRHEHAIATVATVLIAIAAVAALAWPVMHVSGEERAVLRAQACDHGLRPHC